MLASRRGVPGTTAHLDPGLRSLARGRLALEAGRLSPFTSE